MAQESPMEFLVQSRIDGVPLTYSDPVFVRRHDWGGSGAPLGYYTSDNALPTWVANTAVQTWGAGPWQFVQTAGDGGQITSVAGTKAVFWASQDGSYNGLQYFVGPLCGGDGWLLFDTANQINSQWTGQAARLSRSTNSPNDCPPLGAAYTRWMRGLIVYPFQSSGKPAGSLVLDTLLSEHYDHEAIDDSVNMERNWFAKGIGNIRWEAWSKTGTPGNDLAERCPQVTLGGYYYPETAGWRLTDCRYWANVVPAQPGFSLAHFGWP
jgi:hypothetical protein